MFFIRNIRLVKFCVLWKQDPWSNWRCSDCCLTPTQKIFQLYHGEIYGKMLLNWLCICVVYPYVLFLRTAKTIIGGILGHDFESRYPKDDSDKLCWNWAMMMDHRPVASMLWNSWNLSFKPPNPELAHEATFLMSEFINKNSMEFFFKVFVVNYKVRLF